jgi:23S rRNA (pseudouridine1915-N3)-methyltransferase
MFADALGRWRDEGAHPAFVIGGPDGLDPSLKQGSHAQLRLSSLTLPHTLVRVLLAEQLYRAWSLLTHHPYHRA